MKLDSVASVPVRVGRNSEMNGVGQLGEIMTAVDLWKVGEDGASHLFAKQASLIRTVGSNPTLSA